MEIRNGRGHRGAAAKGTVKRWARSCGVSGFFWYFSLAGRCSFYDPQFGTVFFGGADERGLDPEKLMRRISFVFQDVYLFRDTIRARE